MKKRLTSNIYQNIISSKIKQINFMIHSFECTAKHTIFKKKYFLHIFSDEITISQTLAPKYRLSINLNSSIEFIFSKGQFQKILIGFQIIYNSKLKIFHSTTENITKLKEYLQGRIIFRKIEDFYCPLEVIGSGAYSKVQQMWDYHNNCYIVCKKLKKHNNQKSDQIWCSDIQNEIYIMNQLQHQNIIRIKEVFEDSQEFYIFTEYFKGKTLINFMSEQSNKYLDIEDIRTIIQQILFALEYIHDKQILHRDIKPENILIKQQYDSIQIKIIDFGLSTFKNVGSYRHPKCGTPGYIAPEIINLVDLNEKYSEKCDIYSVGIIFFKLLGEKDLFGGSNSQQVFENNKKCDIQNDLNELKASIPFQAFELLEMMLKNDPNQRISSKEALNHKFFQDIQIKEELKFIKQITPKSEEFSLQSQSDIQNPDLDFPILPEKIEGIQELKRSSVRVKFPTYSPQSSFNIKMPRRNSQKSNPSQIEDNNQFNELIKKYKLQDK